MDKYLNEDAITAEIMSYVKNRIYNYAVLIDGDWGTGKTYFIQKSIIPTLEGSGYMPIYISLYGVNSTDTVSQKIALSILTNKLPSDKRTVAKQCLPAIGSFVLPIGQTLLNATGISILEPFFKSPVEDIPWDTIFKKFNDSRKRIFIFDDLERCSLPINEILGYINSLVEHESEKVLIVANQQAMLNVPILKGRLPLPDIFLALSSLRTTYLSPPSTVKMSYPPLIRMFKTKLLSQEKKVMIPFRKQLNFG